MNRPDINTRLTNYSYRWVIFLDDLRLSRTNLWPPFSLSFAYVRAVGPSLLKWEVVNFFYTPKLLSYLLMVCNKHVWLKKKYLKETVLGSGRWSHHLPQMHYFLGRVVVSPKKKFKIKSRFPTTASRCFIVICCRFNIIMKSSCHLRCNIYALNVCCVPMFFLLPIFDIFVRFRKNIFVLKDPLITRPDEVFWTRLSYFVINIVYD